jgi:hypothetical protein
MFPDEEGAKCSKMRKVQNVPRRKKEEPCKTSRDSGVYARLNRSRICLHVGIYKISTRSCSLLLSQKSMEMRHTFKESN